jgi:hypothetical protein
VRTREGDQSDFVRERRSGETPDDPAGGTPALLGYADTPAKRRLTSTGSTRCGISDLRCGIVDLRCGITDDW